MTDDAASLVDRYADRLRQAGWSAGDARFGSTWLVSGMNGENIVHATAAKY